MLSACNVMHPFAEWSKALSNDKHYTWLTSSKCRYFLCELQLCSYVTLQRYVMSHHILSRGESIVYLPSIMLPLKSLLYSYAVRTHANHTFIKLTLVFCGGSPTSLDPFLLFYA